MCIRPRPLNSGVGCLTFLMKRIFISSLFCLALASTWVVSVAQGVPRKVEFKIDEKPTTKQIRIILYAKGHTTEASIADDGTFILPTLDAEWVDVRLVSGKYNLFYERVFLKKLDSDLTFRVFTNRAAFRRLSDTDDKCPPGQSLSSAHDLDFHDGTQMVVTTCK